jgi:hypothetical protein
MPNDHPEKKRVASVFTRKDIKMSGWFTELEELVTGIATAMLAESWRLAGSSILATTLTAKALVMKNLPLLTQHVCLVRKFHHGSHHGLFQYNGIVKPIFSQSALQWRPYTSHT